MITDLTLKGRANASRRFLFIIRYKYNIFILAALLLSLLLLAGCTKKDEPIKVSLLKRTEGPAEKANSIQPGALRFGFDLRLDPKEEVMIYTSFLKYLENRTGRSFRIKFTEKHEDTVRNLGEGLTQFAAIGAAGYISGKEKYGIKYLVSGVNKEGQPAYHSVIITRSDSSIHEIRDLKGRSFAFGPAVSAQGYLIPRKMLEDNGVGLKDLGNYIYTDSHSDTLKAVLNGECDAGGIQDTLVKALVSEGRIRVLKTSEPYPIILIAYNGSVDTDTVESVRSALLDFDPAGKHRHMLFDWDKTEMPFGFKVLNESDLDRVTGPAKKYGAAEK